MQAELVKGGGGIFDVTADGVLVYSKNRMGRFPGNDEILQTLRNLPKT